MAIKIHHGPPGSYKTAGAVNDDLIPAIMAGRTIVTNVRGITMETIENALPDAPIGEFELIHIDTTTRDGRAKFQNWFHWVPVGAFIFIDEAQSIFPKRWKEADLKAVDLPHEVAAEQGRPQNWWDAWDMHRHYNWDVVLTTPEIDKIRDDIRGASELAYKHKNLGLYGLLFKGSYNEGIHSKDNAGTTPGHFQAVRGKRIGSNSKVWKLYQSTATGDVKETTSGFNILSNPRLLIGVGVLAYCAISFVTSDHDILGGANPIKDAQATIAAPVVVPAQSSPAPVSVGSIDAFNVVPDTVIAPLDPYLTAHYEYNGYFTIGQQVTHLFSVLINGQTKVYTLDDLHLMGFKHKQHSDCAFTLFYQNSPIFAKCIYS